MCGIAGLIDWAASTSADSLRSVGAGMVAALSERGPDGENIWIDPEAGVVLAHRRLAIIDLSARAEQPMHSANGRYVMVLNGEIYNYRQLRSELEAAGLRMRSGSDTEVLLEG